jgi:hypothetical protein
MKKVFIIVITIGLSSCIKKHNYKCTCVVTGQFAQTVTSDIHRKKENDAKKICDESGANFIVPGAGSTPNNTVSCSIERQNK